MGRHTTGFKSLRSRLVACFLALGLVPLAALGLAAYRASSAALLAKSGAYLRSQAQEAIDKIDRNLFERYGDVQAIAFHPKARGSAAEATAAADFYSKAYGIYDVLLVADLDGRIVAANTTTGDGRPVDASALVGKSVRGEAWFEEIAAGKVKAGETYYADLAPDPLVAGATGGRGLELNFSAPVFDENGRLVRVWSNRASWERIVGAILKDQRAALEANGAKTVETQLLSRDGLVLDDEKDPGAVLSLNLAKAGLEAADGVVAGKSGFAVERDRRRGDEQVVGYAASKGALGFEGYGWGVLVRQDASEARSAARALGRSVGLAVAAAAAVLVVLAAWLAKRTVGPLVAIDRAMAAGDLSRLDVRSADEVGRMSAAINRTLERVRGAMAAVGDRSAGLVGSSGGLASVSERMSADAAETAKQAQAASAAAEQVSANVQTVATGAEEMSASIAEIAESAADAARVAAGAVAVAEAADARVARLGESSAEVGEVVRVIASIAEQTNLLALNATIEAARAGEAGKGFAVVANEVKELAKETARATEEIGSRIAAIQADSRHAVEAIAEISGVIARIDGLQATIASAVEEQTATTNEINRNVAEAAKGSAEIAENVGGVAEAARSTTAGASETQRAAGELNALAFELRELVGQFKY